MYSKIKHLLCKHEKENSLMIALLLVTGYMPINPYRLQRKRDKVREKKW